MVKGRAKLGEALEAICKVTCTMRSPSLPHGCMAESASFHNWPMDGRWPPKHPPWPPQRGAPPLRRWPAPVGCARAAQPVRGASLAAAAGVAAAVQNGRTGRNRRGLDGLHAFAGSVCLPSVCARYPARRTCSDTPTLHAIHRTAHPRATSHPTEHASAGCFSALHTGGRRATVCILIESGEGARRDGVADVQGAGRGRLFLRLRALCSRA